jgi:cytochrome P450
MHLDSVVEFFTPEILLDPNPFYAKYRETQPVLRTRMPGQEREVYLVTNYDLTKQVLSTPQIYSSEFAHVLMGGAQPNPAAEALVKDGLGGGPLLLNLDEPAHKRYRDLFQPIFGPRQVAQLTAGMEELMDTLIDGVIARGECDFVNDIAVPFPLYVICDMLGWDRGMYKQVKSWGDAVLRRVGQQESLDEEVSTMLEIVEFHDFIRAQIADRRANPRDDLITEIVQARIAGLDPLTDDEALLFIQELGVAGNETTRNTLIGGLAILLQQPAVIAQLRHQPNLIPAAVEEMLRLFAPVAGTYRIVLEDTVLGGIDIPKGSVVMVRMEAANRDPAQFPNPEALDVTRRNRNAHLTFSHGIHYCLGNMLARKELVIAFDKILSRLRHIELVPAKTDLSRTVSVMLRGTNALYIRFDSTPAEIRVPA